MEIEGKHVKSAGLCDVVSWGKHTPLGTLV